jgi:hypothetical protein
MSLKKTLLLKIKMSNFPLYDTLNKDFSKKDLTVKEKEEFLDKIENIDETGRDLVYALIRFYSNENEKDYSSDVLPYKGIRTETIKGKENLTWTFTDFPIKLRHILYKFIKMHSQSMEEDTVRRSTLP